LTSEEKDVVKGLQDTSKELKGKLPTKQGRVRGYMDVQLCKEIETFQKKSREIFKSLIEKYRKRSESSEALFDAWSVFSKSQQYARLISQDIADEDIEQLSGHLEKLKISPSRKGLSGQTHLSEAVETGSVKMVRLLVEKGSKVNEENNSHTTPLLLAIMNDDKEMVNALLELGADPCFAQHDAFKCLSRYPGENSEAIRELLLNQTQVPQEDSSSDESSDNPYGW
jgi:hypothetical protein